MDHDLPDREEIACALEVMESRLARQGQYDQAVDVFAASRLLRLDDDEITRLRAENEAKDARIAELEKDRERLDFIITDCSGLDFPSEQHAKAFFAEVAKHENMRVGFRAAFDAAMRENQ